MQLNKAGVLQKLKEYLGMTVASIVNSVCFYVFVNPTKLAAGGLTGVAQAIAFVVASVVENTSVDQLMSVMYFIINLPIMVLSLILLRGDFTFKSIYSIFVSTLALAVLPEIVPDFQFNESKIIATILGGMVLGLAMHLAVINGGSNGGTEVIGRMVTKYRPELDVSSVITVINFVITIVGGVIIVMVENESIWLVMYSLVFVVAAGEFMGILQRGFDHPQKYLIITTKYREISHELTTKLKRGVTYFDMTNKDGDTSRKMILVIVQYRQTPLVKHVIAKHDPDAFTFVKDIHDVFSRPKFNRSYKQK